MSQINQEILKLLDLTEELIALQKYDEAERFLNEIEKHKPQDLNIPFQRGLILLQKGEYEKAIDYFMVVYKHKPDFFVNLYDLGNCYYYLNKYYTAMSFYKKALEVHPSSDIVMMMYATCLTRRGQLEEGIDYFRRTLAQTPELIETHSSYLMTMVYSELVPPETVYEESKKYGEKISRLFTKVDGYKNIKDPDKRLKIGYVSQDFRDHPVPYFLEPLLRNHDRETFEVFAYSSTKYDNPIMDRMKTCVDVWRDVRKLTDDEIRDLIHEDEMDILIDVGGHTAYNNLKVFARKPAPLQVTWLGYHATTGMKEIDYRITDHHAEPPGIPDQLNTEKLWRLPHVFCCYQPHENSPAVVDYPPFEDNGYITFGCFNNFIKVRDPVMAAWGKILRKVPDSRLLLEIQGAEEPEFLKIIKKRLQSQDCPLDQVVIEPRKRSNQFVLYNKIDIALDPFPCNGGATTMDTLWMGVPLVTLAGKHFAARMSSSFLENVGLSELITHNVDDYVDLAVDLATDKDRLKKIRHNLRQRFADSPAMDQESFARDMEEAYRGMWKKYCEA